MVIPMCRHLCRKYQTINSFFWPPALPDVCQESMLSSLAFFGDVERKPGGTYVAQLFYVFDNIERRLGRTWLARLFCF
jgi:hypothetical protein